jgi:hypothetical protein
VFENGFLFGKKFGWGGRGGNKEIGFVGGDMHIDEQTHLNYYILNAKRAYSGE